MVAIVVEGNTCTTITITTSERARTWLTAQLTAVDDNNDNWGVQIFS